MEALGSIGIVGLAVVLTLLLVVGTKGGGKVKELGWWPCFFLGMIAGSAYAAAGGVFAFIPELINAMIGIIPEVQPGVGMGAIALCCTILILFKKLTTRQVAIMAIVFFYVASGAGGVWSTLADSIARVGQVVA